MSFSYSYNSDSYNDSDLDNYLDDDESETDNFHDYGYEEDEDLNTEEFGSYNIKDHSSNDNFQFFKQEEDDGKPRILLMGLRRSGKSSIRKVVFQKMAPHDTLFLEATTKLEKNDISENSFIKFQIWDFPGQLDLFDNSFEPEVMFGGFGSIVYVIDAQDNTHEAVSKLSQTIAQAHHVNKRIMFEVFLHKVDNINEEARDDILHDVKTKIAEDLENNDELKDLEIRYHTTSIYDHSVIEAFSKVIQRLLTILPTLRNLLDVLVSNSKIEKAFLFDIVSKIYIASDTKLGDNTVYELCSDVIDIVVDMVGIYGTEEDKGKKKKKGKGEKEKEKDWDDKTQSVIQLDNESILYLRKVNKYLALVCLLQKEAFQKMGLIDYNFKCFQNAIEEIFNVRVNLKKKKK